MVVVVVLVVASVSNRDVIFLSCHPSVYFNRTEGADLCNSTIRGGVLDSVTHNCPYPCSLVVVSLVVGRFPLCLSTRSFIFPC